MVRDTQMSSWGSNQGLRRHHSGDILTWAASLSVSNWEPTKTTGVVEVLTALVSTVVVI